MRTPTAVFLGSVLLWTCAGPRLRPDDTVEAEGLLTVASSGAPFDGVLETRDPDSGEIISEARYREGLKHGRSVEYDERGRKILQEDFVAGKRDGERLAWWPIGQLARREIFVDGVRHGLAQEWSESGGLTLKRRFEHGRREGRAVTWHENGQIKSEATYEDGSLEGLLGLWYPSGEPWVEKRFRRGFAHGAHREWYEDGTLRLSVTWRNGEPNGQFTRWHQNGQVQADGFYVDGSPVELSLWSADGTLLAAEVPPRPEAPRGG